MQIVAKLAIIFTSTRVYMKSDSENLQKYNIPLKNVNKRELKLKLVWTTKDVKKEEEEYEFDKQGCCDDLT